MKTVVALLLLASAVSAHIQHAQTKLPSAARSIKNGIDYDDQFLECCKAHNVSHPCQNYCSYGSKIHDVYEAFLDKTCNIAKDLVPYLQCEYNFKDARECCREALGSRIKGYEYCLDMCDGSTPLQFDVRFPNCPQVQEAATECGITSRAGVLKPYLG